MPERSPAEGGSLAAVGVVVPVHDEEELLGRYLSSLALSAGTLLAARPGLAVQVVVVLDRCTDGSAAVAARHRVRVVAVDARSVGVARAAGAAAYAAGVGVSPQRTWLAHTDADTEVPPEWLLGQVTAAERGARLVLGAVRPDPADLSPLADLVWHARHRTGAPGSHVHGANLGVRLDAYQEAGGFPALTEHEDVGLVAALAARGVLPHPGPTVLTSGRHHGRVPGGFAGYLRDLQAALGPRVADEPAG